MALTHNNLLDLSGDELDELFRRSPAGEIPNGDAEGKVLVGSDDDDVSDKVAWIARTLAWKGKVFDPEKGELRNKILPLGHRAIVAKVYKDTSWFDQKECIALDYSETSLVAKWIRDEIREVSPRVYLGIVFWGKTKLIHFALKFPATA